jgi:hypothetical protein
MKQSISNLHCLHHIPKQLTIASVIFGEDYLLDLAVSSGFYKRSPRKIDACSMLAAICAETAKGSPSCNDLAASIESSHPGEGPSRQAVHLRMGDPLQAFIHKLLEDLIARVSNAHSKVCNARVQATYDLLPKS